MAQRVEIVPPGGQSGPNAFSTRSPLSTPNAVSTLGHGVELVWRTGDAVEVRITFSEPVADGVAETEETLTLTLANSVGAEVDDATATGTIADAGEPESEPAPPLTARFRGVPAEHDGENAFSLRILFSEGIGIGYKTLRDESVSATGGTVTRARRVNGRNDLWEITVRPSGHGDATVTLAGGRACGTSGAVCTRGDSRRPLANSPSATVRAQAALSVADAKVQEGPGASVEFRVSLSRAASGTVTVEYATSNATATAGEDYTAASGTLRFGAGETSKTIAVSVLDDAHDEGHETFTLRLSNASGARIRTRAVWPGAWR